MFTRNLLLSAASAAALALSATDASADIYTPSSESMSDPKISGPENAQAAALGRHDTIVVMYADGDYATAKQGTLNLPFHIEAETSKNKWRIKDSFIIVGLAPIQSSGVIGSCCGSLLEFHDANFAVRIEHGNTEHVDKEAWWNLQVGNTSMATRARNACRNLRKDLEQQGLKHDEIFAEDRATTLPTEFRYVARVAHKNANHDVNEVGAATIQWKQSQPIWPTINVICERDKTSHVVGDPNPDPTPIPTGSNDIAMGFQVNQAALAITPKQYKANCPAKLHLNPTIEATGKGTVKYRFVDQLGHKSQTFQVKFDKSEVKFLDHVIEIDGKGKPKGLGFAAAQPQGGALGLSANTVPNLTQGYFQLEVLSPHKKLSNIADYSVKCTVQAAGNGELIVKPDVVKPVVVGDLAVGLADLFIEDVQPSPKVPTKLFVKVTNKGKAASTPTNMKAQRWVGDQSTTRGTLVPAVQPGQSQVVLAELGGTYEGADRLYLRVDDPNRIAEGNEKNNTYKVKE